MNDDGLHTMPNSWTSPLFRTNPHVFLFPFLFLPAIVIVLYPLVVMGMMCKFYKMHPAEALNLMLAKCRERVWQKGESPHVAYSASFHDLTPDVLSNWKQGNKKRKKTKKIQNPKRHG